MPKLGDVIHVHSRVDTGTLKDLCAASMKLYQSESHGKVFCWIDSSSAFLQTAVFSVVRLAKHVAFSALSLVRVLSQNGRRFLIENLSRSAVDLTGVAVGILGTLSPWAGEGLTAREIMFLNRFVLKNEIISTGDLKGMTYESPIWITRYMYQYNVRMQEGAIQIWGGPDKVQYKSKA